MVIDTSAVIAILGSEADGPALLRALLGDVPRLMSALTLLETYTVSEARGGTAAGTDVELFVQTAGIEVVPMSGRQAEAARLAWRRYGKGNHPAGLNLGDCCVYALARLTGEPVLCKGEDFRRTDITVVAP